MSNFDLWVDFNDLRRKESGQYWTTSLDRNATRSDLVVGGSYVAGDFDGNTVSAEIEEIKDSGIINVLLDMDTWKDG